MKKRSTSSSRRSGAVSSGACTGAVAADGAERRAPVVVLAHANATLVLEVVDLDHPVRDLEAAVLPLPWRRATTTTESPASIISSILKLS